MKTQNSKRRVPKCAVPACTKPPKKHKLCRAHKAKADRMGFSGPKWRKRDLKLLTIDRRSHEAAVKGLRKTAKRVSKRTVASLTARLNAVKAELQVAKAALAEAESAATTRRLAPSMFDTGPAESLEMPPELNGGVSPPPPAPADDLDL